jgi:aldose 1-epimerase
MERYTLEGSDGLALSFIRTGAAIVELLVPDRHGELANVVLAHADLATYATQRHCLGAVCGRYANRIDGGRLKIAGEEIGLAITDRGSNVHGGPSGFDRAEWTLEHVGRSADRSSATLSLRSPDGDQGFPGTLDVTVTYRIGPGSIEIVYKAVTDRPTVVSLTNHSYFNLAGAGSGSVEGHWMQMYADAYTPSDDRLIPFGTIEPTKGTPFDFTTPKTIGRDLRSAHPMMLAGQGFDVNFVLSGRKQPACQVWDPVSGRRMTLHTSAPGIQFYSGNGLDGTTVSRNGRTHRQSDGFCLEPHHYPNSPNVPEFPSPILLPGQTYESVTRLDFDIVPEELSAASRADPKNQRRHSNG